MTALGLSDRDRTLLTACLCEGRSARDAFAAWRPFANPADMQGSELRLMPLLLANLQRVGIDDPILRWLRGQTKHIWLVGQIRLRAMERGLDALVASGIPVTLIKGAALMTRWPREVDTRPMGDFDLLVRREHVRLAIDAVRGVGFSAILSSQLSDADLARFHALGVGTNDGTYLDIHWRAAEVIKDQAYSDGLMRRAIEAELAGRRVRISTLSDHLFVLLAHAFNDAIMPRCDWIAEVALLFRAGSPEEWDWTLFENLTRRYGLGEWATLALQEVSAISGLPLPAGAQSFKPLSKRRLQLQQREITLRGKMPTTAFDKLSWRIGVRVRGQSPIGSDGEPPAPDQGLARLEALDRNYDDLALIDESGFDVARSGAGASFVEGWSIPEHTGRWSEGRFALLAFRVQEGRIGDRVQLRLSVSPYLPFDTSRLDATVWAGCQLQSWSFSSAVEDPGQRTLDGRLLSWKGKPVLIVAIAFGKMLSAEERWEAGDHRGLGLYLRKVQVVSERLGPVLNRPLRFDELNSGIAAWLGWGDAEPSGRWTVSDNAELRFRLPEARRAVRSVRLDVLSVFAASAGGQVVDVQLNGRSAQQTKLPVAASSDQIGSLPGGFIDIEIPPNIPSGALIEISLAISTPVSPASLGLSNDGRRLGLLVKEICPLPRNLFEIVAVARRYVSRRGLRSTFKSVLRRYFS
jgi:hypothetical protein